MDSKTGQAEIKEYKSDIAFLIFSGGFFQPANPLALKVGEGSADVCAVKTDMPVCSPAGGGHYFKAVPP